MARVVKRYFSRRDRMKPYHSIGAKYGIIALTVKKLMTPTQQDSFVYDSRYLSHLCVDRTCCDWRHFIVEPGPTNISRNACFSLHGLYTCEHHPRCLRWKKVKDLTNSSVTMEDYQRMVSGMTEDLIMDQMFPRLHKLVND